MGDRFYRCVVATGLPLWKACARPVLLHRERVPVSGALILAPTHGSPYDVPCLIGATPRVIDFLSIVEMQRKRLVGPFYRAMNCVFVDRHKHDVGAARLLKDRLTQGRAIAIFPEGNIRAPEQSIVRGGPFKPGVIKLAQQTGAPIQPCVLMNTNCFSNPMSWLPIRRAHYGINYGELIHVDAGPESFDLAAERLRAAYIALHQELLAAITSDTSIQGKTPAH